MKTAALVSVIEQALKERPMTDQTKAPRCLHQFDTRLCCDGLEHYYPCVMRGCNTRQYFCKHTQNDRHCPRAPR